MSLRERREVERLREIHVGQEEKLRRAKEWLVQRRAFSSCISSFSSVSASSPSPTLPALATAARDEPAGPAAGDAPASWPLEEGTGTKLLSETKEGGTQTEQPLKTEMQRQAMQVKTRRCGLIVLVPLNAHGAPNPACHMFLFIFFHPRRLSTSSWPLLPPPSSSTAPSPHPQ